MEENRVLSDWVGKQKAQSDLMTVSRNAI